MTEDKKTRIVSAPSIEPRDVLATKNKKGMIFDRPTIDSRHILKDIMKK